MQTRQLSYILEIADRQSLSAASKSLGISQPALSQYLASLEKQLGYPLFFSSHKRLFPTDAGSVYINAARRIIEIKEHSYRLIRSMQSSGNQKQITAGVSGYTSMNLIGQAIPEFYRKFPNTEIKLEEAPNEILKQMLAEKRLELAVVGYGQADSARGQFFQFSRHELLLVIPRVYGSYSTSPHSRHALASIQLKELKDIPLIVPETNTLTAVILEQLFSEDAFNPHVAYRPTNLIIARQMVKEGLGACFLFDYVAKQFDNDICDVFSLKQHPQIDYGVSALSGKELSAEESYLIYCILKKKLYDKKEQCVLNAHAKKLMDLWET